MRLLVRHLRRSSGVVDATAAVQDATAAAVAEACDVDDGAEVASCIPALVPAASRCSPASAASGLPGVAKLLCDDDDEEDDARTRR